MKNDGRSLADDDLERKALGSLLVYPNTKAVFDRYGGERLFYRESSRWAWRAVAAITEELGPGAVYDGAAVVSWLTSRGAFTDAGGSRWFNDCKLAAVPAMACESVGRQLRELYERRQLMRLGDVVREMAWEGNPREEVLGEIKRSLGMLAEDTKARSAAEVATAIRQRHDDLAMGTITEAQHTTGVPWLDWAIGGGVCVGHAYFLCGLYKQGKTKLAGYLIHALLEQGWRVDWYSVEMTETEMMARILSCDANVSETRLNHGKVGDRSDYARLINAEQKAKGWKWRHQIRGKWRAEDIAASAAHYKMDNPKDRVIVVVDYIQDVGISDPRGMKTHEVIGEATRQMKSLATELDIPVLVLSQLTPSKVEGRAGANNKFTPVPVPSDMRGSADGLMHAHHLLILHRPWWQMHGKASRFTVLDLALTRTGGNRRIYLYSDLTYNRYQPWADDVPRPFDVLWADGAEPWSNAQ